MNNLYNFIHFPIEYYYFVLQDNIQFHYNDNKQVFINYNQDINITNNKFYYIGTLKSNFQNSSQIKILHKNNNLKYNNEIPVSNQKIIEPKVITKNNLNINSNSNLSLVITNKNNHIHKSNKFTTSQTQLIDTKNNIIINNKNNISSNQLKNISSEIPSEVIPNWYNTNIYINELYDISMIESLYYNDIFFEGNGCIANNYNNSNLSNQQNLKDFEIKNKENNSITSFPLHYIKYKDKLYLITLSYKLNNYYHLITNELFKKYIPLCNLIDIYENRTTFDTSTRYNDITELFRYIVLDNTLYKQQDKYQLYIKHCIIDENVNQNNIIENNQSVVIDSENYNNNNNNKDKENYSINQHDNYINNQILLIIHTYHIIKLNEDIISDIKFINQLKNEIKYYIQYYLSFCHTILIYIDKSNELLYNLFIELKLIYSQNKIIILSFDSANILNELNNGYKHLDIYKKCNWLMILNLNEYIYIKDTNIISNNNDIINSNDSINSNDIINSNNSESYNVNNMKFKLNECLNYCKKYGSISTKGIQVIYPEYLITQSQYNKNSYDVYDIHYMNKGVYDNNYDKNVIFNLKYLKQLNFMSIHNKYTSYPTFDKLKKEYYNYNTNNLISDKYVIQLRNIFYIGEITDIYHKINIYYKKENNTEEYEYENTELSDISVQSSIKSTKSKKKKVDRETERPYEFNVVSKSNNYNIESINNKKISLKTFQKLFNKFLKKVITI